MRTQAFTKLHGAGNDFVLIDHAQLQADPQALALAMADRHCGVGFDQLMLVQHRGADIRYQIYNADGSSAQQCGNGARAVAFWLCEQALAKPPFVMQSPAGPVQVRSLHGQLSVTLGKPSFTAASIPFLPSAGTHAQVAAGDSVTANAQVAAGDSAQLVHCLGQDWPLRLTNLGNPHATLLVDDCAQAPVQALGQALQQHPQFPERVNVGFCQVLDRHRARLRVYERGVGETLACGSGACAAAIQLIRAGLSERTLRLLLPGGELLVHWPDDAVPVELAGPVRLVFRGEFVLYSAPSITPVHL